MSDKEKCDAIWKVIDWFRHEETRLMIDSNNKMIGRPRGVNVGDEAAKEIMAEYHAKVIELTKEYVAKLNEVLNDPGSV